tara:strand:- start:332 stop:607 length:276 start_codon:yes stop_codon:yes gene_type:complete
MLNSNRVQLTSEEETARDAEEKAWADAAPARRMVDLRQKRNALLDETDYMALGDVTLSDAWKTYRQALRDITDTTPSDDALSNITFPTKPS